MSKWHINNSVKRVVGRGEARILKMALNGLKMNNERNDDKMKIVNVDTEKWGTVKVILDECVTVGFPLEIDVDEDNKLYVKGFEKYNFKNGNKLDLRVANWHEEYEALR